jgi:hypothetical protein
MFTVSPSPLSPRTDLDTGSKVPCFLSRQTLVLHSQPSILTTTDVRPHGAVARGAYFSGTRANVQPPGPGMRKSRALNLMGATQQAVGAGTR